MPVSRVEAFLQDSGADFSVVSHGAAFTAPEVAESAHIHGDYLAKAVMVNVDGMLVMVVLPAHYQLSLELLRDTLAAESIELASESEFSAHFKGCELGALPPFGSLFGMPVYVATEYDNDDEVAFSAGSHTELVRMPWSEYLRVEKPECLQGIANAPEATPPKMVYRRGRSRI